MRSIQRKNGKSNRIIILASVVIVTTLLTSGCNRIKQSNQTDSSASASAATTVTTEFTGFTEETMPTYDPSVVYNFEWTNEDSEKFSEYIKSKFNIDLQNYVSEFGFTQELCVCLTEYVNSNFNENYEVVPFSEVKYFRSFIAYKDAGTYYGKYKKYDTFCNSCLKSDDYYRGVFNSKLIICYLIQYNIPFGSRIPLDNLKYVYGDDIYSISSEACNDYVYKFRKELSTASELTKQDYVYALMWYNYRINLMAFSEGIPTRSFVYYAPEDEEKVKSATDLFNEHLRTFYGSNAFQFGEVPTREQYIAIFGEEPLDLSYLNTPAEE